MWWFFFWLNLRLHPNKSYRIRTKSWIFWHNQKCSLCKVHFIEVQFFRHIIQYMPWYSFHCGFNFFCHSIVIIKYFPFGWFSMLVYQTLRASSFLLCYISLQRNGNCTHSYVLWCELHHHVCYIQNVQSFRPTKAIGCMYSGQMDTGKWMIKIQKSFVAII